MGPRKPALILPVESQVREFDAKLLLACVAAERGYEVILGYRADIDARLAALPRGLYLSKSLTRRSAGIFRLLKLLGYAVGTWDEEALVYPSREYYFQSRMSSEAMPHLSLLLAWGNDNAEVFRKHPSYPGTPIHVAGNPRIDLLRPELRAFFDEDVRDLRERFGRFLLVNTNFSQVNGETFRVRRKANDKRTAEERERKRRMKEDYSSHKRAVFDAFRELVPALSASFPETQIIVRPHPSERRETWQEIADASENIRVVDSGNVLPWLLASSVMIHNGCTTAIEAFALGRRSIAYRPVTSQAWDHAFPNALSHECMELDGLLSLVSRVSAGEVSAEPSADQSRLFEEFVVGSDGPLASDRVVDAIDVTLRDNGPQRHPPLRDTLRGLRKATRRRRNREHSKQAHDKLQQRHERRFPAVPLAEVQGRIERLNRSVGRFADIRIEPVAENIFRIEA